LIELGIIGPVGLIYKENLPAHRGVQFNLDKTQNLNKIRKIADITGVLFRGIMNSPIQVSRDHG